MINRQKIQQFVDLNGTGDKAAFCFAKGAEILAINIGLVGDDAGGGTVKLDKILASTRGDGDIASITIPAADLSGQVIEEIPASQLLVEAGAVVVVEVTAESFSAATNAVVEVVYKENGIYNANTANVDDA
jgi:hypothetical protein